MAQAERERLTTPIVDIHNLSFAYDEKHPVLRDIDLEITEGSIVLVIGISGGGKTTLLKLITGLLQPTLGEIRLFGEELQHRKRSCDSRVAYIPQQLGLVKNLSVEANVLTGALARVNPLSSLCYAWFGFPKNYRSQAQAILQDLGIAHKAQEQVFYLSGGERQRVAIARALMQQAKLILADEFVSQLDEVTTSEIMNIVQEAAQKGITFIITTHEPSVLRQHAKRVIILKKGEKFWDGQAGQIQTNQLIALMR